MIMAKRWSASTNHHTITFSKCFYIILPISAPSIRSVCGWRKVSHFLTDLNAKILKYISKKTAGANLQSQWEIIFNHKTNAYEHLAVAAVFSCFNGHTAISESISIPTVL